MTISADILVVARNQPGLFEYLRQVFMEDPDVKVVIDRRQGDRRRRAEPWSAERRRQSDRRTRPALDEKLRDIGFAIVKRD